MPELLGEPGLGPISAAHLIVAWSHRGRCRSEAAFATLAGVSPLPAFSGRITAIASTDSAADASTEPAHHRQLAHDPRTPTHPALPHQPTRSTKTDAEIRRRLNCYTARHLFRLMEARGAD